MAPPDALPPDAAAPLPGWTLRRRPHGRVDFVAADGTLHADVDVLCAFPLSAPRGPAAVLAADGSELAWIESIDDLPEPLRTRLLEELSDREFLPTITAIRALSDTDPAEWTVLTDRGPRRFTLAGPDDVERLPDGSALVSDASGVRYRIASIAALDARSRRLLDRTME
ncbi:MAG: DUF1854 domain-containing protein [Planctomycetaceae bacterium]